MLNDVGVQVVFSKDGCKMMRGAMVLAKGTRRGTLFSLMHAFLSAIFLLFQRR